MIRVVLDTNVIVSAIVFGGLPREILEMVEAGGSELFYSEPIQEEVRRVLADKFRWHELMLSEVLATVWQMGKLVVPSKAIKGGCRGCRRQSHSRMRFGGEGARGDFGRSSLAGFGELPVYPDSQSTSVHQHLFQALGSGLPTS